MWGNKGQKQKPQKDTQLQQIVDKTIIYADQDGDGKISYEEFCAVSALYIYIFIIFTISYQATGDMVEKLATKMQKIV